MKITSEDILKTLGINVGDYVIVNGVKYKLITTKDEEGYIFVDPDAYKLTVSDLIDIEEFEHIKNKGKVGETRCCDYKLCSECPLCILSCENVDRAGDWFLYAILNEVCYKAGMKSDNPIYKAFRAELDKEVE